MSEITSIQQGTELADADSSSVKALSAADIVMPEAVQPAVQPAVKPAVKSAVKSTGKPTEKPALKSAGKPAAMPTQAKSVESKAAAVAASLKAQSKAKAPTKPDAAETAAKPRKAKLVRDSFSMPDQEYAVLLQVKKECLKNGFAVKKSELLRIGVGLISQIDMALLQSMLVALPKLIIGRPKKK